MMKCRHALSTDCNLSKAPRRRTDGAIVVDTDFYVVQLYTVDGATKLIKRKSGSVERQFRVTMGKLPVGYRSVLCQVTDHVQFTESTDGHNK